MNGVFKHLPNLLTALQLAAAPAFAFLLVSGADRAALGVFAFAGLTDAADGFLAKRFGIATRVGRFLDPAADKLLMFASFLTLTILGVAPLWLTLLVIARDAAIVGGILFARLFALPIRSARCSSARRARRCRSRTLRSRLCCSFSGCTGRRWKAPPQTRQPSSPSRRGSLTPALQSARSRADSRSREAS